MKAKICLVESYRPRKQLEALVVGLSTATLVFKDEKTDERRAVSCPQSVPCTDRSGLSKIDTYDLKLEKVNTLLVLRDPEACFGDILGYKSLTLPRVLKSAGKAVARVLSRDLDFSQYESKPRVPRLAL